MLVAKVEEHLAAHPEDGRGWDVIAPVYLRLGRADDAARAFQNAIRLLGSTAERQTGLGEAILSAEGGIVTADARTAFEAAQRLDPAAPGPRFFLALAAEQEGEAAAAADALADAPRGSAGGCAVARRRVGSAGARRAADGRARADEEMSRRRKTCRRASRPR